MLAPGRKDPYGCFYWARTEINDLLHFVDSLRIVVYRWEENTDQYAFRISELIQKHKLTEQFPVA